MSSNDYGTCLHAYYVLTGVTLHCTVCSCVHLTYGTGPWTGNAAAAAPACSAAQDCLYPLSNSSVAGVGVKCNRWRLLVIPMKSVLVRCAVFNCRLSYALGELEFLPLLCHVFDTLGSSDSSQHRAEPRANMPLAMPCAKTDNVLWHQATRTSHTHYMVTSHKVGETNYLPVGLVLCSQSTVYFLGQRRKGSRRVAT